MLFHVRNKFFLLLSRIDGGKHWKYIHVYQHCGREFEDPAPVSTCTCTCGDDDVGPTDIREIRLPWSRFDVLVLLWGPRNNKQTGRKIKKSTFQAVEEVGKQMIICSQFEIEIDTGLYSEQKALDCKIGFSQRFMGALLTWDPRSDIFWRWGENIWDWFTGRIVARSWAAAGHLMPCLCPWMYRGLLKPGHGHSTALLRWGEGWE